jgi:adenylate cyclase
MERFINILVIESERRHHTQFKKHLTSAGNIVIFVSNAEEAVVYLQNREIGIVLCPPNWKSDRKTIQNFKVVDKTNRAYFIAYFHESEAFRAHECLQAGYVDYLLTPFVTNTLRAKIKIFKNLYLKDQRIGALLGNLFPEKVLSDLNNHGKYSPRRVENGVVLFTDFVEFSRKSKKLLPLQIVERLEYFFNRFDEICDRYQLEKIKTIGDSYMAIAGVTEDHPEPTLRTCLAALEMRHFMTKTHIFKNSNKDEQWDIRIGIHSGPLVAGILGKEKMSFDVWGDTVNLAARAEQISLPGKITVSSTVQNQACGYFNFEDRGEIEITKRGGREFMFFLNDLKTHNRLFQETNLPNGPVRELCGLESIDYDSLKKEVLNMLENNLPENLLYHAPEHTLLVENSAARLADFEGLNTEDRLILLTGCLFHDTGFTHQYSANEIYGIQHCQEILPSYGYNSDQINQICEIIASTCQKTKPKNKLEELMSDADHDYFGRVDYFSIADKLRKELAMNGTTFSDIEWIDHQLAYLENKHRYFSDAAKNIRLPSKKRRIGELKKQRTELEYKT